MFRYASKVAVIACIGMSIGAPPAYAEKICYEYDVHGRVVKVIRSGPDNDCTATTDNSTTEYEYDDAGNRIEKDVDVPTS